MTTPPLACVILAAGRGTRMKSDTPKLLHPACGRPVLEWTLRAILELGPARTVVVVPPDGDALRGVLPDGVEAATQERPLGTGDAARSARAALAGFDGDILVMNGDHPLTDPASLRELAAERAASAAAAAVLTFDRTRTIGADFGRIVRDPAGAVERIVELRDTTAEQRELAEVNSGIYLFRSELLWPALERLDTANDQGELYLTDVVGLLVADGHTVAGYRHDDATVALGINTRADLAAAAALLRDRINLAHMLAGVTITDPASTWIEPGVTIAADACIEPFTVLRGDDLDRRRRDRGAARRRCRRPRRPRGQRGAVLLPAPRRGAGRRREGGHLRRDQELRARRRRQGAASLLHRRCVDRGGHEHRSGRDHRQLRWPCQAADNDW